MAENTETSETVQLELEPINDKNEEDEDQTNSGQHEIRASDSGDNENDNVCLSVPYGCGRVPPIDANMMLQAPKNTSVLVDRNKKFMKSLKRRDITSIKEQLEINPDLVMYSDDQGFSVLSEAAKAGPKLLDAFLLKIKERPRLVVCIEYALLYAIKADNYESVEFLLGKQEPLIYQESRLHETPSGQPSEKSQHAHYTAQSNRRKAKSKLFEDAEFPAYLTPVILAAQLHRVEILKLLLEKPNASEIHPLTVDCPLKTDECEICSEQRVFKSKRSIEESKRLIEIYKALSSPIYILNAGVKDPVLEAFKLSRKMQKLVEEDPPFKAEYDAICKRCREFVCDLLDLCRSTEEIETLLRVTDGIQEVKFCPKNVEFQRIILAVSYGQKEFITHPSCQQVLQRKWYDGLPNWVCKWKLRNLAFVFYIVLWCFCWPFACVGYMLKLSPWLITFMKQPINKFISNTISFALFLVFLVIECNTNTSHGKVVPNAFSPTEFLIIFWIGGMLGRLLKVIWRCRYACRINVSIASPAIRESRWYDVCIILSFMVWFVIRLTGYFIGKDHLDKERVWKNQHLLLISEGFFSVGTLLSFVKLIALFKANSSLGPLQISLTLMLRDILRFLVILFITMIGFVMAFKNIHSNYKEHTRIEGTDKPMTDFKFYLALFWSFFDYGNPPVTGMVTAYFDDTSNSETNTSLVGIPTSDAEREARNHKVMEVYGHLLFGAYVITVTLVLINMLIAMMARSYHVINCNADLEWKYARTKLCMMYFSEVGSLPPPFNVGLLGQFMKRCMAMCANCCKCCRPHAVSQSPTCNYTVLVLKLRNRYLSKHNREFKDEKKEHEI